MRKKLLFGGALCLFILISTTVSAQETKTLSEKDTVIRLQFGGLFGFTPSATDGPDYGNFNMGVNYSRYFTSLIGINVGLGMEIPVGKNGINGTSQETEIGGSIEAGPSFKFGRIFISPMIGYGLVYHNVKFSNGDSELKMEHYFRVICGVDFFILDFLSISGEIGYIVGYVTDRYNVDLTSVSVSSDAVPQGFCFSLGVGIAY